MKKNNPLPLLLADDLSQDAGNDSRSTAIRTIAARLAIKLGASIELVCVENFKGYPTGQSPFKKLIDAFLQKQKTKINQIAKGLETQARGSLIAGEPARELVKLTQKRHAYEMIILGTHGRKGMKRVFLGSVAEEVIRHSKLPVMTLGPNAQSRSEHFLRAEKPKILIATSLSQNSLRAEAYGLELAHKLGAEVVFFHNMRDAIPALLQTAFANPYSVGAIRDFIDRTKANLLKKLKRKAEKINQSGGLASCVLDSETLSVTESLMNEVKRSRGTLVVMGTHGHSMVSGVFFGRTARDLILQSSVPVITVHSKMK